MRLSDVSCDAKIRGWWDLPNENDEDDEKDETRRQTTLVARCFSCGGEMGPNDLD